MFFKKKKNILKYRFFNVDGNIQSEDIASAEKNKLINTILEPAVASSSCWFSNLKPFVDNYKTTFDFHRSLHLDFFKTGNEEFLDAHRIATAKQCPGINQYLKNSFLVKSPAEVIITVNKDGSFVYRSSNEMIKINNHDVVQFYPEKGNIFEGKINIKINVPVMLRAENSQWLIQTPYYHTQKKWDVTPGVINGNYAKEGEQINVICMFDVPKDEPVTYKIEYGEVLAYLWFPEKMKLVHDDSINTPLMKHIDSTKAGWRYK